MSRTLKLTVDPGIAQDVVPVTSRDIGVLLAKYEEPVMTRVGEDQARPML